MSGKRTESMTMTSVAVDFNILRTKHLEPYRVYFLIPFLIIFFHSDGAEEPLWLYTITFISWYASHSLIGMPSGPFLSAKHGHTVMISTIHSDPVVLVIFLLLQLLSVCLSIACFWTTETRLASLNVAIILVFATTVDILSIGGILYVVLTKRMQDFVEAYFVEHRVVRVEESTRRTISKPFITTFVVLAVKEWSDGTNSNGRNNTTTDDFTPIVQDIQLEGSAKALTFDDLL